VVRACDRTADGGDPPGRIAGRGHPRCRVTSPRRRVDRGRRRLDDEERQGGHEVAPHVVLDSKWESSAAYHLEAHQHVVAFVENQGLGLAIPYLHSAGGHEYVPDFLVRLDNGVILVLETKGGRDERAEIKPKAAERWVAALNADGGYGEWRFAISRDMNLIPQVIESVAQRRAERSEMPLG
jgi:hypothetical protein